MAKCISCGAEIKDDAKFCPVCGGKQELPQNAPQNVPAQAETGAAPQNNAVPVSVAPQSGNANNGNANNGNANNGNAQNQQTDFSESLKKLNDTEDKTSEFDKGDIEKNKPMAILAYLSILVLVPIIAAPNSKFTRFHANQGLLLAICEVAWWIVYGIISTIIRICLGGILLGGIATILNMIIGLAGIVFIILSVIGIINAANGRAKRLPVIGKYDLIK